MLIMLYNTIFNKQLSNENADIITHLNLFFISCYSTCCIYFDADLKIANAAFLPFLFLDILFIPYTRYDTFFHHGVVFMMNIYNIIFNIELNNYRDIGLHMFKVEISSCFLCSSFAIKKLKLSPYLYALSNSLFISTFVYYRIYYYYHNIINNRSFYDVFTTNSSYIQPIYQIFCTYSLFGLNLYWLCIITKIIFKKIHVKEYVIEYILKYSYCICLFSNIFTYFHNDYHYSNDVLIFIYGDILCNAGIAISSYFFHDTCYHNLIKNNDTIDISDKKYQITLAIDLFFINIRSLYGVFTHFYMNQILHIYQNLLYTQVCFCIGKFIYIYGLFRKTKSNNNMFMILYGINPFVCIVYNTIGVFYTMYAANTYIILYSTFLIITIKPFYKANHLMIHLLFIYLNYLLVLNNLYLYNIHNQPITSSA